MNRHGPYRSAPHPSVHRNPWTQGHVYCSDSRSTHSSGASSHTYHVLNGPQCVALDHYHEPDPHSLREAVLRSGITSIWFANVHQGGVPPFREAYRSVGRHPVETGAYLLPAEPCGKYLLGRERSANFPRPQIVPAPVSTEILDNGRRSRPVSSRALTPTSGGTDTAVIVPCGGHCIALENFCHYFLQVAFLGGVLSGLCLVVAGRVLQRDLAVLIYIGTLTALVSGVLLWVQCMVKRGPRRRHARHHHPPQPEIIPLQHLQHPPPPSSSIRSIQEEPPDFREECSTPWWRREDLVS